MARTIIKRFRVDKTENEVIKTKADMCCLTESELIQMLVMGFIPREAPPQAFYTKMNELNMVGVNLKQLIAKANTLGFTDIDRLNKVVARIDELTYDIKCCYTKPEKDVEFWQ